MHRKQRKNIFAKDQKRYTELSDLFLDTQVQRNIQQSFIIKNHTNPSPRIVKSNYQNLLSNVPSTKQKTKNNQTEINQFEQKHSAQSVFRKVKIKEIEQFQTQKSQQPNKNTIILINKSKIHCQFRVNQLPAAGQGLPINNHKKPGLVNTLHEFKRKSVQKQIKNKMSLQVNGSQVQKDLFLQEIASQYCADKIKPFFL